MQMLAYFCATEYSDLKVINGEEKGGELQTIQDVDPSQFGPGDVFLDCETGDFYVPNSDRKRIDKQEDCWEPAGNVGLHKIRTDPDPLTPEKSRRKRPTGTETSARIRNMHVHYWAFSGFHDAVFRVCCRSDWDVHPVVGGKAYTILAETDRGPVAAERGNTLVLHFGVDQKYRESVAILQNYICRLCDRTHTIPAPNRRIGRNGPRSTSFCCDPAGTAMKQSLTMCGEERQQPTVRVFRPCGWPGTNRRRGIMLIGDVTMDEGKATPEQRPSTSFSMCRGGHDKAKANLRGAPVRSLSIHPPPAAEDLLTKYAEIARILHPRLGAGHRRGHKKKSLPANEIAAQPAIRRMRLSEAPPCRYKEFERVRRQVEEETMHPKQSPYLSEIEQRILEQREGRRKWITPKGFRNFCGSSTYKMLDACVVGKEPSSPVACHRFRMVDKSRWLANNFKF